MSVAIRAGFEATHGTVTTDWVGIPCSFSSQTRQKNWVPKEARMVQDPAFSVIPGVTHEEWQVTESPIYHDSFGIFLGSALGAPTKTVVDTIFDNEFLLEDDPKSLSIEWDQLHRSTQPFRSLWNVVDELEIAFDIDGQLTFRAGGVGMPRADTTTPTYAFSTARPFAVWQGAVTYGGSGFTKLRKGLVRVKRNRKPWRSIANTQAPSKMTIGDRLVTFELLVDFATTDERDDWLAATVKALEIVWEDAGVTIGSTSHPTLTVRLGSMGPEEAEEDDSGDLPALKLTGTALYDATDTSAIVVNLLSTVDYTA